MLSLKASQGCVPKTVAQEQFQTACEWYVYYINHLGSTLNGHSDHVLAESLAIGNTTTCLSYIYIYTCIGHVYAYVRPKPWGLCMVGVGQAKTCRQILVQKHWKASTQKLHRHVVCFCCVVVWITRYHWPVFMGFLGLRWEWDSQLDPRSPNSSSFKLGRPYESPATFQIWNLRFPTRIPTSLESWLGKSWRTHEGPRTRWNFAWPIESSTFVQ